MKLLHLCLLLLIPIFSFAQENDTEPTRQIGLTGLPIFYLNNGAGGDGGFSGLALYANYGWLIKQKNVVGVRPFFGMVDNRFNQDQRMYSAGTNGYYRRYFYNQKASIFVEASTGLGYLWYRSKDSARQERFEELNGIMFNFAFGPGLNLELKNGFKLELLIQYLHIANISHPEDTMDGSTLIPSIGVQKFF